MARLENKIVLISGGASGIGAETARLVVREGGKAVLGDRDADKGAALAKELGAAALFVPLDVTQEADWQKAVAATVETFGGLHGLLNSAGVGVRNTLFTRVAVCWARLYGLATMCAPFRAAWIRAPTASTCHSPSLVSTRSRSAPPAGGCPACP